MVALALSHGQDVDWEKVSSSHARCPKEMKEFFIGGEEICAQSHVLDSSYADAFNCCAFI
jgi:hypothetical protein